MASVRKLYPKGHPKHDESPWVCEYTNPKTGKRVRITPKTGLKKDADAARRKVEAELERGVHVARADGVTFENASKLWIEDCERRHKTVGSPARSTIVNYHLFLRKHLNPRFGGRKIDAIKGEEIQDFLNEAQEQFAYATLHHFRMMMTLIIRFSIKSGFLLRNVMTDQEVRVPGERKRIQLPSQEQIGRLLQAMSERKRHEQLLTFYQRRAFVGLGLFSGLRVGEICALQWEHLDFERDIAEIRHSFSAINGMKGPKTKAGIRDVPLAPVVRHALVELRTFLGEPVAGFVFQTKSGENMRQGYDNIIWRPLMGKAGMTHPKKEGQYKYGRPLFHFHALRHAAVSLLIKQGVNSMQISAFIGHSSATTTLGIYGHLFPEDDAVRVSMATIADGMTPAWGRPEPIRR